MQITLNKLAFMRKTKAILRNSLLLRRSNTVKNSCISKAYRSQIQEINLNYIF